MLLLLLIACTHPAPPVVLTGADAVTEENLNRVVLELQPLVEEAAGRTFEQVPFARLGRASDLETILEEEFRSFMGAIYPNTPDWVQREMAQSARASAPGVIGKFGVHTGVLYLAPDAVARIIDSDDSLGPEAYDGVARLVLAHEMAHALQEEAADLQQGFASLRDRDHFDGLRGATEGHANMVERRVAAKLGLEELEAALNRTQGWNDEGPTMPATVELWALYGQGRHFVEWHWDRGGAEAAWQVVREPPASTQMLFRPETYAAVLEGYAPRGHVTQGVDALLSEGAWITIPSHVNEISLRAGLFGHDPAEVDLVLAHLDGFTWSATRQDRSAEVHLLTFSSPEWAARYLALCLAPVSAGVEEADPALAAEVTAHEIAPGAVSRRQPSPVGGVRLEVNELWVPMGAELLLVRTVGFRPGRRVDAAAALMMERLGQGG